MTAPRLRLVAAALFVAGAALVPRAAGAFTVLGYTWTQMNVPYYINPANMDVPVSAVGPAVRAGADVWQQQAGIPVALTYAGETTQTTNTNDGVNMVMFRNVSSGTTLATTYTWFVGNRIVDADVVFWDGGAQFFTGTTGCSGGFYIEDIAAHEFGHALGLGHSDVTSATMYPSISTCSRQNRTLDPDDVAAIQSLYPAVPAAPRPPAHLRILIGGSQP